LSPLDSGKGKERLRAPPNQSVQDLPATKTFEEEETLQDTEMTDQELESDEEVTCRFKSFLFHTLG